MPRYYFNLKDGRKSLDAEGLELADIDAARNRAVIFSGEVLRDGGGDTLERRTLAALGYGPA